jgi:hypothetical protein
MVGLQVAAVRGKEVVNLAAPTMGQFRPSVIDAVNIFSVSKALLSTGAVLCQTAG